MKLADLLTPERRWRNAIWLWQHGNTKGLESVIRHRVEQPQFAVDFLVELAAGTAKKSRGRPDKKFMPIDRDYFVRVKIGLKAYDMREDGFTKEEIIAKLADDFNKSESSISHIIYPRLGRKNTPI